MNAKSCFRTATFLSGLCAIGLFAGCASRDPNAQSARSPLKVGMSRGDVRQLMGSPKEARLSSQEEIWRYNDHAKALIPLYSLAGGEFSDTVVKFDADGKVKDWWILTRSSSLASGYLQLSPF